MKSSLMLALMIAFVATANAWEWQGIKENMTYDQLIKVVGVPTDVNNLDKTGCAYVDAIYAVDGYSAVVKFSRCGIDREWKVTALTLTPKSKVVQRSQIIQSFGMPTKVGRHDFLGLMEVYANGAIVKYSFKDDSTVLSIQFGYEANL